MKNTKIIKILGFIATAVGIGASLLSDYVQDRQIEEKIEECINKKLNGIDEEDNEDEDEES